MLATILSAHEAAAANGARLSEITGKQYVRIVYTRSANNNFPFDRYNSVSSNQTILVGWDNQSKTENVICSDTASYHRPLISKDGDRVIFTNLDSSAIYVVDWHGNSPPRKIISGQAGSLWHNPANDSEYVVFSDRGPGIDLSEPAPVRMANIDNPSDTALIFNEYGMINNLLIQRNVVGHWLSINKDMSQIAGLWGWPNVLLFNASPALDDTVALLKGAGCWPSMPYDSSDMVLYFRGNGHDTLAVQHSGSIDYNPLSVGYTINHPRIASYSNRIICASGGMTDGNRSGGFILIMLINNDFSAFADRDSIMQSDAVGAGGNGYPDLWCADELPDETTVERKLSNFRQFPISNSCAKFQAFSVGGKLIAKANTVENLIKTCNAGGRSIAIIRYRRQDDHQHIQKLLIR
jgi:hypothetical protein